MARKLANAFPDLNSVEIERAAIQMEYLAKGECDAVAVLKLSQLGIDIPFKFPVWNDKAGNDEYWPKVQKWAARQLGLEVKDRSCKVCNKTEGFTYDKTSKSIACNACGKEKVS